MNVEIEERTWPLDPPARSATQTWTSRTGLILTLTDDLGRSGRGECSPLPGYSPDSLETCHRALIRLDRHGPAPVRFAIETAELHIEAQKQKTTFEALIADGAPMTPPLRCALVASVAEAHAAWALGTRAFKIKVCGGELSFLRELRAEFPEAELRLDANGSLLDPVAFLKSAAVFSVRFIEEPCRPLQFDLPVPVAVDESLITQPELTEHPGVACVVLKPTLHGLAGALSLGKRARQNGKDVAVTHCYESDIGRAACHAVASRIATVACGL